MLLSTVRLNAAIWASDGSAADVQSKHDGSADGDTITMPTGSFHWSTLVTLTKAVTLKGLGTIATDTNGTAQSCGTIIIVDGGNIIEWDGVANKTQRMTGIQFLHGTGTASYIIVLKGLISNVDTRAMRVDRCVFSDPSPVGGFPIGSLDIIGVIDHCTFAITNSNVIPIYVFHANWNNQGPNSGGSWVDSFHAGTGKFLFIEDNAFTMPAGGYSVIDGDEGSRVTFRNNFLTNGWCEVHGTEIGYLRGGRAYDIYNNNFVNNNGIIVNSRSATVLVHDNTVTGGVGSPLINIQNYRSVSDTNYDTVFGTADGTNAWDVNDVTDYTGNGWGGGTGGLKMTGTATGGSANVVNFSALTPALNTDALVGWQIKKTSANTSPQKSGYISGNTATSITWQTSVGNSTMSFVNGDTFTLHRVLQAIDMPGRGQGSLLDQSTITPSPPAGWNDQVTDPCYEWNNGGGAHFNTGYAFIVSGVHYFPTTAKPGYVSYTYPYPLVTSQDNGTPAHHVMQAGGTGSIKIQGGGGGSVIKQ